MLVRKYKLYMNAHVFKEYMIKVLGENQYFQKMIDGSIVHY
jgi:hypothetical protein